MLNTTKPPKNKTLKEILIDFRNSGCTTRARFSDLTKDSQITSGENIPPNAMLRIQNNTVQVELGKYVIYSLVNNVLVSHRTF